MKLDVVVPTFNRSALLQKTLYSLLRASVPHGLEVTLIVVDNNSKDDTRQTIEEIRTSAALPIVYIHELHQGSSWTRNAGITAGKGDLIGFVDDDEEVDLEWFHVVAREFADPATQFIGGPYLANWAAPAPAWLPPGYHAAIGHIPPKSRSPFGPAFSANLMGGNAVIRRSVFDRIGTYSTLLGRSGKGLLSEEDAEFCRRLQAASIHGMYVPDLIIHHYIPVERLTRKYHRRWAFWRGVSQGVLDRTLQEPLSPISSASPVTSSAEPSAVPSPTQDTFSHAPPRDTPSPTNSPRGISPDSSTASTSSTSIAFTPLRDHND